jgi:hypothetical protein
MINENNSSINLFELIPEFKIENVLYKLGIDSTEDKTIYLNDCKLILLYLFGKKYKKKDIIDIISKIKNENTSCLSNKVLIDDLILIIHYIKNKPSLGLFNNFDLILIFYSFLKGEDDCLNYTVFVDKIKQIYPSLTNQYLDQIFITLNRNKDGILTISDLEKYLNL